MKNTKDTINMAYKPVSVNNNRETVKTVRTERGVKRGHDVEECVAVENNATKRPKTQNNCIMSTDNVNNSFVPHNTFAAVQNENDTIQQQRYDQRRRKKTCIFENSRARIGSVLRERLFRNHLFV